jgi:hypothetical protein
VIAGALPSCSNKIRKNELDVETLCVKLTTLISDYKDRSTICVGIPQGAKKTKEKTGNDDLHVEYRFMYRDSSTFYIRNDVWSISQVNIASMYDEGVTAYKKQHGLDTLRYSGASKGTYWNETVLGDFTLGYRSSSQTMKNIFDKAINSVTRQ